MTGLCYVQLRQHDGGTDTKIRFWTKSWPWRRKPSRLSCGDSNLRPFDHESGAIPRSDAIPRSPNDSVSSLWSGSIYQVLNVSLDNYPSLFPVFHGQPWRHCLHVVNTLFFSLRSKAMHSLPSLFQLTSWDIAYIVLFLTQRGGLVYSVLSLSLKDCCLGFPVICHDNNNLKINDNLHFQSALSYRIS